ncbi:MAG: Eco57I restriction-modification methylase domain-containing protein [Chloroflexi bacterium]|nr:Eco57I restriction-modification methylase domain-containing protein [Chloroflexota bacterium]
MSHSIVNGAVFTRPWVVELMLDLAGYVASANLVDAVAYEPAAGDGAFLVQMAARLITSCRNQQRPFTDCPDAIHAYELDAVSAEIAKRAVIRRLSELDVPSNTAKLLANTWVKTGNYLLEVGEQFTQGAIFAQGNTDYVIGNPPYIRLEDIPEQENVLYRNLFATMKGRADIYIAFYELALRQLKPGGVCSFICADRWMYNQYGEELRRFITSEYSVETVIEMHHAEAFATSVSAYPAITIIRRQPQGSAVVASANPGLDGIDIPALAQTIERIRSNGDKVIHMRGVRATRTEGWFNGNEPWPCTSPERLLLLKQLERNFPLLESDETGSRIGIGVATGADAIYLTHDHDIVESDRLLPIALTDDITTGVLRWSRHYLINPWDENGLVDLAKYPKLRAYYETHRPLLYKRHVAQRMERTWYRTIDRVDPALLHKHKLYIPDIKNTIHVVLDPGTTYPHHNLYYVTSEQWDLEILGALLMSNVGRFFVECYGVRMRGGYLRMQAQYLRRIRVPRPESINREQAQALTQAFQNRDVAGATHIAYELYGIDDIPE